MSTFNTILAAVNGPLYEVILVPLLTFTGIYFTIRTKAVQITMLPEALRVLTEKSSRGGVSSFQALMISTASRVGTGNIAGVATALAAGGAGAIFWMWLLALLGSASAFIESTLAQIYKQKDGKTFRGGPAYYIERALGQRWLGIVFSILLIACFAFGFNALQSFNVSSAFEYYAGTDANLKHTIDVVIGLILAAATAATIFGGTHRIGVITSVIVPIMAIFYIGLGIFISLTNLGSFPEIFNRIFQEAFDFRAIAGGFAGSCVMQGIKRGLFSNEAGMGSAPNAGATADVSHPAKQGMVQMISVFIDTLLICTTTAMMLLVFNPTPNATPALTGMPLVQQAVSSQVGTFGIHFITVSILLFAFSSLIGNYCYAESNLKFICENKLLLNLFRIICVVVVFAGSTAEFETVWNLADVLMGFMAIVNIISILLLGNIALKALEDYRKQKNAGENPQFHPEKLGIKNTDCWEK